VTERQWTLPAALGLGSGPELVAFIGGGGKTSLLFALAAALPGRVVITTTTRIFAAQMRLAPAVVYADDLSPLGQLLDAHGRCLVVGHVDGEKARGVSPGLPARLLARPDVDAVLVEADGSRMRPVKAPAAHEPVIPSEATLVVPVAGLDALEGPIDQVAHRAELVRRITNGEPESIPSPPGRGLGRGSPGEEWLTAAGLARLLTHPEGGLKGAPDGARVVPFLNKVESAERLSAARTVARLMLRQRRVERVVLGAARTAQPVAEVWRRVTAVVLAAGESQRMGRNKLLLPWGATTVLGQTLDNLRAAAVHDVVVVTGHEHEQVETIVRQQGPLVEEDGSLAAASIHLVHNNDYTNGMLTSVQAAVRALPPTSEAILVVLGDQPMVGPETLDPLLTAYAATSAGLVAPTFGGRRGNPVLIDRRYFAELLALSADAAPRALLARHPDDLLAVPVASDAVLHDLDLPEQYARFRPEEIERG
jgi:molybdenum cofactor cytidylyltransferase